MNAFSLPLPANISELKTYKSSRSQLKGAGYVFMDAGECPTSPLFDRIGLPDINRYPDPTADALRDEIATLYGLEKEQIITTCGIDELIDLFTKTFVRTGRSILTFSPTFPLFAFAASVNNKRFVAVNLYPDFTPDIEGMKRLYGEADILILCTPNNPTGTAINAPIIRDCVASFPGLVVVDEAYGEFAAEVGISSAIELLKEGAKNLLVCRTFSKAYRAAGIRLGYGVASAEIIACLRKAKLPYNVNALTQRIGIELLRDQRGMKENVQSLQQECRRVAEGCRRLRCNVSSSITHFFLLTPPEGVEAESIYEQLRDSYGIAVRPYGVINGRSTLRVNVGTASQNDDFLFALSRILS